MDKKTMAGVLFASGEVLLILAFLHFGKNVPGDILTLNILVTSVIYSLYASYLIRPAFADPNSTQRSIGSMGVRGTFYLIFTIAAITAMIFLNGGWPAQFTTQLIIHLGLLFGLGLGVYFSISAADQVDSLQMAGANSRFALDDLRQTLAGIKANLDRRAEVPQDIAAGLSKLQEDLRYLSPSNAKQAVGLEQQLAAEIEKLGDRLTDTSPDNQQIITIIHNCEIICRERKQVYSN